MRNLSKPNTADLFSDAKRRIDFENANSVAKEWWTSLESLNKDQPALVLKLARELEKRSVSITDFFDVWLHSHRTDLESNLKFLDTISQDKRARSKGQKKPPKFAKKRVATQGMPPLSLQSTKSLGKGRVLYRPATKTIH